MSPPTRLLEDSPVWRGNARRCFEDTLNAPSPEALKDAFARLGPLSAAWGKCQPSTLPRFVRALYEANGGNRGFGPTMADAEAALACWVGCGVDLNEQGPAHDDTLLHEAVLSFGFFTDTLVEALLSAGADPNVRHRRTGQTPLWAMDPEDWSTTATLTRFALVGVESIELDRVVRGHGRSMIHEWLDRAHTGASDVFGLLETIARPSSIRFWHRALVGRPQTPSQRLLGSDVLQERAPSLVNAWTRVVQAQALSEDTPLAPSGPRVHRL